MNSANETAKVQRLFGVEELSHVQDFVALLTYPLGAWQAQNWDPKVSSTGFTDFCDDLLGRNQPNSVPEGSQGQGAQHPLITSTRTTASYISNYASYIRENVLRFCRTDKGQTLDECFGTFNDTDYQQTDLGQTWRSWTWQYCTGESSALLAHMEKPQDLIVTMLPLPASRMGLSTKCGT